MIKSVSSLVMMQLKMMISLNSWKHVAVSPRPHKLSNIARFRGVRMTGNQVNECRQVLAQIVGDIGGEVDIALFTFMQLGVKNKK